MKEFIQRGKQAYSLTAQVLDMLDIWKSRRFTKNFT